MGIITFFYSKNFTVMPVRTCLAKFVASQLVKRMQPCEDVFDTKDGLGVPWIPNDGLDKPIQTFPTGLFGPEGKVNDFKLLP